MTTPQLFTYTSLQVVNVFVVPRFRAEGIGDVYPSQQCLNRKCQHETQPHAGQGSLGLPLYTHHVVAT